MVVVALEESMGGLVSALRQARWEWPQTTQHTQPSPRATGPPQSGQRMP